MAEELSGARAEYGISYWSIESDAWETLGPVVASWPARDRSPTDAPAWEAIGLPSVPAQLCGERVFTVDAPAARRRAAPDRCSSCTASPRRPSTTPPSSTACAPAAACCSLDMLGYGLSAKPDRHYTMALQADVAAAFVAELAHRPPRLLTHDMGDTVGGELLARRAEGAWPVEVAHRVVTNGSIYIEQAHLTDGQQLLLGLPDELLPEGAPDRRRLDRREPARHVQRPHARRAPGLARGPGAAGRRADRARRRPPAAAPPHPLHRGAAGQRAALHRRDRDRPVAAARRLGSRRPDRRPLHGRHPCGGPPRATAVRLDGVGHYPMVEAPQRFLDAVLPGLS